MQNTGTIIAIVLVVVLAVLLLGGVGMMGGGMMGGMMGGGMMGGFGFNPFGMLISLVFWALLIGGIVWLVVWLTRSGARSSSGARGGDSPVEILKARYAKGEITQEQFREMKKDLEG